jgi:hypothetical protein
MGNTPSRNVVIQVGTAHLFITPLGFHTYATDFLMAARELKAPVHFSPVPYYLLCRSIELSLKSYLLGTGVTKKTLKKKLGHDLEKILKRAKKERLSDLVQLTVVQEKCLEKANKYYASKGFEYFEAINALRGYRDRPALAELDSLAAELVSKLKKYCADVVDHSELKDTHNKWKKRDQTP